MFVCVCVCGGRWEIGLNPIIVANHNGQMYVRNEFPFSSFQFYYYACDLDWQRPGG